MLCQYEAQIDQRSSLEGILVPNCHSGAVITEARRDLTARHTALRSGDSSTSPPAYRWEGNAAYQE